MKKHKLIFFPEEGYLKGFFEKTRDMSPEERGRYLEEDEVSKHGMGVSLVHAMSEWSELVCCVAASVH